MEKFPEQSWERLAGSWRGETPPLEESDRALWEEQFLIRRAALRAGGCVHDVERAWRRHLAARRAARRVTRWIGYAAALAALILVPYLLARVGDAPSGGVSLDIVPGTARAELQLSSGEIVPLDARAAATPWRGRGIVLVNDTAAGRLRYDVTGEDTARAPRYHVLNVPRGGEYQLELPDGTMIWINSRSSVRFPERFAADAREVYLQGEAYFVVARDDRAPFRVHAGEQVITVTGTTFNVSAYDDDEIWRATLVEGSVRVSGPGGEVTLSPSTQHVLDRARGTSAVEAVDASLYTSWVHGRFHFRAYAFDELVKKLERWYDFQMIYKDESVKKRRFTGFVDKHEPIERMFSLLEMTTNIQFQVIDKTITVTTRPAR
ncbi:MAG: FecR domain-containing protein [Odoribacteraceae bacterium]|jgi:ferric-dicitrate binding protein FerR (iron transport regulator)|nr:FecR domain-containing protein [Odoribacteraceae bacterium]